MSSDSVETIKLSSAVGLVGLQYGSFRLTSGFHSSVKHTNIYNSE